MSKFTTDTNDKNFEQEVLQASEPVLVDFWAEWCAPCRAIAPMVEALAEQFKGQVRVMKLNVDENSSVSQRYGIKGIPTLILFCDGKEAERIVGAIGKDALSRLIEKHTAIAA